jgi:hypothetical protein
VYLGAAAITVSAHLPLAHALHTWAEAPAAVLNHPRDSYNYDPKARCTHMELAEDSLINSSWNDVASAFSVGYGGFTNPHNFEKDDFGFNIPNAQLARLHALLEPDLSLSDSTDINTIANASPYIFSAKSNANSKVNPSYDEAMKGVHQKEYTEAACAKLSTLQDDLDCVGNLYQGLVERMSYPQLGRSNANAFPMAASRSSKPSFVLLVIVRLEALTTLIPGHLWYNGQQFG